jgi:hypothetical protein
MQVAFPVEPDNPLHLLVAPALLALGTRADIAVVLLLLVG